MLTSITPLGERGRANRWPVTTTAYILSSALAATAVGAALGALGSIASPSVTVALVVTALAALLAAGLDATGRKPPGPARQVDENWLRSYRGWVYGIGFGAQLGVGVVTIVTSATVYAVGVAELATGSAALGAAVGLAFGLARALPLIATRGITTTAALSTFHRRVAIAAGRARWAAVGVAGVVGVAGLIGALT